MKKNIKKAFLTLAIIGAVLPFSVVSAKNGTITKGSYKVSAPDKTSIKVEGTIDTTTSAVQTLIFSEDGKTLIGTHSVAVEGGKFTDTISVKEGTYLVKTADYDGGNFAEAKINTKTGSSTSNVTDDEDEDEKENKESVIKPKEDAKAAPKTGEV